MKKNIVIGVLLSSIFYFIYWFLFSLLEINKWNSSYHAEYSKIIEARPGLESMLLYNDTLVMSQFNKIHVWEQKPKKMSTGAIYIYKEGKFVELKHDLQDVAFRPYGISVYGDKLMAINEGYE
jgi:hypothetical protein